jgi:hypothetical protein
MKLVLVSTQLKKKEQRLVGSESEQGQRKAWRIPSPKKSIFNDRSVSENQFNIVLQTLKFVFILLDIGPVPRNFLLDPLNFSTFWFILDGDWSSYF